MTSYSDCKWKSPAGKIGKQSNSLHTRTTTVKATNNLINNHSSSITHTSFNNNTRRVNETGTETSQPQSFIIRPFVNNLSDLNRQQKKNTKLKSKVFGDHLVEKESGIIRIVSQNVNCIGVSNEINHKQEHAKDWIYEHSVDVMGWQETGVAFHSLPIRKRLAHRMKDIRWDKMRISSANNKHENVETFQYGGTAVLAFNTAAHRVKATGSDETGLGRWSWILFEGKHKFHTRIISAYVPCKSTTDRFHTVYNQHRRYFNKLGINDCPRKLMHTQLCQQIQKWQNKGENIVLLIDTNENLARMGQLQSQLIYECQLVDPIRSIYQKDNTTLPPTSLTGSNPIDSIFVSPQLQDIVRGGWIQVEKSIGDHRALFIDVPIETILGEDPFTIHRNTARRLICNQPKIVERYNKLLNRQLSHQHTFKKFREFEEAYKSTNISTSTYMNMLNKIDSSITNSILHAERKCRKLKAGTVPYSPELSNIGKVINVWNNVLRKKRGCNISSTYIKRISKKAGISKPMDLSMEDCIKERNLASKKYRKLKRVAKKNRIQFIQDLATQQSERGNESISNAINRINRNEELRESYKRIKVVTKPFFGATEKVLIPSSTSSNEERITTDKLEIEQALRDQNMIKFTSAYSSPFLQHPLKSQIRQTATTSYSTQILNGKYKSPSSISKATKVFIKHLKTPKAISRRGKNNPHCDIETATTYWKKKLERTNSSMSGRHIGTYKALTYNNLPTLQIVNAVSDYAFQLGNPLERWTKDLDVSLLKKPNKIRPSELRTIGTLEADFNQLASLHFSKRMMHTGIITKSTPPSQYAKKGNRSIEAAIVKILFFDYIRITKTNGAFLAMDLENCFDRMAHPISSLCSQRLGVPPKIAKCMINTLCKMKHFMRTAYGDSDWSYCGTTSKPLQGAVQGNGAASPIFIAISCVILSYLEHQTVGVHLISAIILTLYTVSAIMYVDDSDILISSVRDNENYISIRNRAQKTATVYKSGVHQTGGAIRPEKCRWYLICYKWINGIAMYDYNPNITDITITDSRGNDQIVERLDIRTGWKGLGIVSSPSGNWKDHVTYLIKDKIEPWNASIRSSYLQKHDVYRSAFTFIFKSIDYTLPATSLTSSQCQHINAQLHKKYLPRIGIDSHMPLPYRYAPHIYQGLGSLNVQVKQFLEKIKIFMTHVGTQTQLGQSIQLNLEAIHIAMGINTPLFDLPYSKYYMLAEQGWIQHLWKATEQYQIKLQGLYMMPTINRNNDFAIMEKIIELDLYTDEDVQSINRCRIYLRVQNLSEIVNGEGNSISYCARNRIRDPDRISKYKWPNQPFPKKNDWEVWEDLLQNVISDGNYNIVPSLGQWNGQDLTFETHWKISNDTKQVFYKASSQVYNVYEIKSTNRRNSSYLQYSHSISTVPDNTSTIIINRSDLHKLKIEAVLSNSSNNMNSDNNIQHHTNLFMKQINFPKTNIEKLISDIENGTAIAVTDASVSPYTSMGASSFVLTSQDLQTSCNGAHGVPKGSTSMDSYRAEIYGIYGILVTLQHLVRDHNIQKGRVLIACDNKAGLLNSLAYNRATIKQGSFDILWAIYKIRQNLPIEIAYQHVRGHQDETGRQLNLLETLNCIMDRKAKQYREYIESSTTYEYSKLHFFANWTCTVNENVITENLDTHLREHIYYKQIKHYLTHNKQYPPTAVDNIDWIAIGKAAKSITIRKQIWVTKYVSGFCATGSVMKKRKLWDNHLCPICHQCKETTSHIITCQDERSIKQYNTSITKFFNHLERVHTDPTILHIFKTTLSTSTPSSFISSIPSYETDHEFQHAAREQDEIGWINIFKGHLTKKWSALQMKHFCRMYKNPPSLHHWSKSIVRKLYDVAYEMWMHRNNIVHEKYEDHLNKKASEQLHQDISMEFRKGSKRILQQHKHLFKTSLRKLYKKPVIEKQYWLLTVRSSRTCFDENFRRNNNTRDIILEHAFVPD